MNVKLQAYTYISYTEFVIKCKRDKEGMERRNKERKRSRMQNGIMWRNEVKGKKERRKNNIEKRNEKANEKINMKRTPYASDDFLDQNTLTYIVISALFSCSFLFYRPQ